VNKWRRLLVRHSARRPFALKTDVPYISFTFDDFPRSAYLTGGRILSNHLVRGTYFVSMQLLGAPTESGVVASESDLRTLLSDGHELGCHTFAHLDGTASTPDAFERSIVENRVAFQRIVPGGRLPVFSYPLDGPWPRIKRAVGNHFVCCRGGGQTFNANEIDLNLLNACFLDVRNRNDAAAMKALIEESNASGGWLIFATHDVTDEPSRYGCRPEFFEEVVGLAVGSGARVLPMNKVCEELKLSEAAAGC
jgi:peptidoglycan/xylan/chitin deacetylase (PgdA/CDA1 family)